MSLGEYSGYSISNNDNIEITSNLIYSEKNNDKLYLEEYKTWLYIRIFINGKFVTIGEIGRSCDELQLGELYIKTERNKDNFFYAISNIHTDEYYAGVLYYWGGEYGTIYEEEYHLTPFKKWIEKNIKEDNVSLIFNSDFKKWITAELKLI